MSINEYCIKIHELLLSVGELNAAATFKYFVTELEVNEGQDVYRKIISIYGGAGSFNDLVLYKNGVVCIAENNELDSLRNGLYNKIAEAWN